jgi:hypothetical protein
MKGAISKTMKNYEAPTLKITASADIITASAGDTPTIPWEW